MKFAFAFAFEKHYVDVGTIFWKFQQQSLNIINDAAAKMDIDNMNNFLAMNYIWNMEYQLQGLDSTTHNMIKA
ncbi:hypothetical protein BGZ76_003589, partial [Entomortierella beljakovae]